MWQRFSPRFDGTLRHAQGRGSVWACKHGSSPCSLRLLVCAIPFGCQACRMCVLFEFQGLRG